MHEFINILTYSSIIKYFIIYKNEMNYFQDTNRSSRNKNNNRKAGDKYLRK